MDAIKAINKTLKESQESLNDKNEIIKKFIVDYVGEWKFSPDFICVLDSPELLNKLIRKINFAIEEIFIIEAKKL